MNTILRAFALLAASFLPFTPVRADPLPPARLACSFAYDDMLAKLGQLPLFQGLNKDKIGSPVLLRIIHSVVPTAAGSATGLASAVLSGGTLGLLPVVENKDLVITYDLFVNETLVATYAYQKNFTRAFSIYSKDKTQGLGEDGQTWALSTVDQFAADIAKNAKVAAVVNEYRYYFGAADKPVK